MSVQEYVKFLTEQLTSHFTIPKQSRKQHKERLRYEQKSYTNEWFGMLPFALKTMFMKEK